MAAYSVNIRKPTPLLLAKKILSVPFNALACATPGKNYYFACFVYLCLVLVPQGNYSPHVSTLNTVFPQYSGNMGHDPSSSRSLFPGEHHCSPSLIPPHLGVYSRLSSALHVAIVACIVIFRGKQTRAHNHRSQTKTHPVFV